MAVPDQIQLTSTVFMSRADPYPAFEQLRRRGPVFFSPTLGAYLVTGLDEAHQALKNPLLGRADLWAPNFYGHERGDEVTALFRSTMLFSDPPDHGRLRAFMSTAFQPRVLGALRGSVENIVDGLIEAVRQKPVFDAVESLARPIPVEVIANLIGVPREDWQKCVEWSAILAPLIDLAISADVLNAAVEVGFEFADYIIDLVEQRRNNPQADILSTLVQGLDEEGGLTEEELAANVITLFTAGHETTANLISNTFVLLDAYPEQRALLDSDLDAHLDGLIEESLRFESPIQVSARIATEDTEVANIPVHRGRAVWTIIGAANRDPRRFEDPERFDLTRNPNPHIAFGSGIHHCLGIALARMEAQIALGRFFSRCPQWRLAEQTLELRDTMTLRGYSQVLIALD